MAKLLYRAGHWRSTCASQYGICRHWRVNAMASQMRFHDSARCRSSRGAIIHFDGDDEAGRLLAADTMLSRRLTAAATMVHRSYFAHHFAQYQ